MRTDASAQPALTPAHRRRLRELWRSAGWPAQDLLEAELLAWGLLERLRDGQGRETLRLTDAGIQALVHTLNRNRAARSAHEALVERVAAEMARAGRIAWRGLSLRAQVALPEEEPRWVMAMPDVFSIRHTTVEAYLEPIVHEVKVRRADLLGDVRNPAKREAYLQLSGQCWYVLAEGIGTEADVPPECGVLVQRGPALEVLRAAPRRSVPMAFGTWMALARATPERDESLHEAQAPLTEAADASGAAPKGTSPDAAA